MTVPVGVLGQAEHGKRPAPHLDREDLEELDLRHEHARERVAPLGERAGALEDREVAARVLAATVARVDDALALVAARLRVLPARPGPPPALRPPRVAHEAHVARARLDREGRAVGAQLLGEQERAATQVEPLVGAQEGTQPVLGDPAHGLVVGLLAAAADDVALEHAHPVEVGVVDRERLAVHLVRDAVRGLGVLRPRRALEPDRERRGEQVQLLVVEEPVESHGYHLQTSGIAGWSGAAYFLWIGCTTSSPKRRICSAASSSEGPSTIRKRIVK